MRKVKIVSLLIIIFLSFNVYGTSGNIKQDSVIECNGKYYGHHGNPTHWHLVEKKNDKWVSISGEVSIPACYVKGVNEKELVTFSKCADGDTARFIIKGEERKVRFLAIDTFEVDSDDEKIKALGKKASDYTCNALKNAKEIYLEYDSNSDKEDKYGRVLAFVHVDGVLLEKSLVEKGLAKVYYIYGDYEHVDELRKVEEKAKEQKLGIWSDATIEEDIEEDQNSQENVLTTIINFIVEIIKKIIAFFFE